MAKILQTGKNRNRFNLIELIVTIAVLSLVASIVIGRIGKTPNALFLDKELEEVRLVLENARITAIHSHKNVEVIYKIENEQFTINNNSDKLHKALKGFYSKTLLPEIKVKLPENKSIYFYPNGTATKSEFIFSYKGHKRTLVISPLTATITKIKNEQN